MPASLPGPIGKLIAKRLESAVYQCESLTAWEDLYMYIITDPKWEYDDKIPLKWRERIIEYFLDACKQGELDEEVIDSHASALKSGDGLKERSASEPTTKDCDFSDETSNAGTVRASEIQQAHDLPHTQHSQYNNRPTRIIFFQGSESSDGVTVCYSDIARSRISQEKLALWEMEDKTFDILFQDNGPAERVQLINMNWELQQGHRKKSYTTCFEVVNDEDIDADVEFGRNRFEGPHKRSKQHAPANSLPEISSSNRHGKHKPRTQTERSFSQNSKQDRDEFIMKRQIEYIRKASELDYQNQVPKASVSDHNSSDSDAESLINSRSTARTSVSGGKRSKR